MAVLHDTDNRSTSSRASPSAPLCPDGKKAGREGGKEGGAYLGAMRLHCGLHCGSQCRESLHPVLVVLVLAVDGEGYPRGRLRGEGEGGNGPRTATRCGINVCLQEYDVCVRGGCVGVVVNGCYTGYVLCK